MTRPRAVYINGLGLSCALGRGVDACVRSLVDGRINTVPLDLDGYSEPVRMRYYALPGEEAALFDTGRFLRLLPEAASEALEQAGVGREARRGLPLFVGSTAFAVSRAEGEYLELLAREPGATFVFSQVLGINDQGIAVGYYGDSTTSQHGFIYNTNTGVYTFLDDPSEAFNNGVEVTQITGITNSGEITGFYSDVNGVFHGFVATPDRR